MTTPRVHVVAAGARTPVGLCAAPSAAAVRAGIIRIVEHPFMFDGEGEPLMCAMDPRLDPAVTAGERLVAMAETALREACEPLGPTPGAHVPVYLGLPELRPGFEESDAQIALRGIESLRELPIVISKVFPSCRGHAAGLSALADAVAAIEQGAAEICLVGGLDTYLHLSTIEWLGEHRQLACPSVRSGFVPGEAAGFCLLMAAHASRRLQLRPLAQVSSVAVGHETKLIKTIDVCLGHGLDATIGRAMAGLPTPGRIQEVICDLNGERYRNEEWGFTCLRAWRHFVDPSHFRSPAESWGDVGAASGPLFAMLACQAGARGYARGTRTMLWASSEGGTRAAAVLDLEPRD